MGVSIKGAEFIVEEEKFVPIEYRCNNDKPTIGFGHVLTPEDCFRTITKAEAEAIKASVKKTNPSVRFKEQDKYCIVTYEEAITFFKKDLKRFERVIDRHVKVPLAPHQYDALISFVFNIGATAFADSTALKLINKKAPIAEIGKAMKLFHKVREKNSTKLIPSQGLINRREREFQIYSLGKYNG